MWLIIAGLTLGTPIHVFVPNTDQRGKVSLQKFPVPFASCLNAQTMYTLMWYRLRANGIIFLFWNSNRITVKCLKHTDPHTLMQHTTSSTAFVLFRYHLFFLPLHFFNPLAHQELRIVQHICGLI